MRKYFNGKNNYNKTNEKAVIQKHNIDEFVKIKINENTRVVAKTRNGCGKLKLYFPKNRKFYQGNMIFKKKSKFKIYKSFMSLLKIDVFIFSNKRINFRELNNILFKVLKLLNNCSLYYQFYDIDNFDDEFNIVKHYPPEIDNPIRIKNSFILILFLFIFFIILFIADFNTVKTKVKKENLLKINELEHEYQINNCETRGHLQALKSRCNELKANIDLFKKDEISNLSVFIIWIIDNVNHIYHHLGLNLFITLTILLFIYIKF